MTHLLPYLALLIPCLGAIGIGIGIGIASSVDIEIEVFGPEEKK